MLVVSSVDEPGIVTVRKLSPTAVVILIDGTGNGV